MGAIIIFGTSLVGIVTLLSLKVWELKRGTKPFSVLRYKADVILRKEYANAKSYLRYFNRQTAYLLLLFILNELKEIFLVVFRKGQSVTSHPRFSQLFRGKQNLPFNSSSSRFLQDIATIKSRKEVLEEIKESQQ